MSTSAAFTAKAAAVRAVLRSPSGQAAVAVLRPESPFQRQFRELERALAPVRETIRQASFTARAAFDQVMEHRRRIGLLLADWNPFAHPLKVTGLQEHLSSYRRRSVAADLSTHIHMRALLSRRNQQSEAPGRLVTTHPQVTRGPNTHTSIFHRPPVGILRV